MSAQQYLDQARQLQALSLTVHLPLVCFGLAFPSLVVFAEWRYLRTGDTVYRTIAKRWSKVMLTLFAVGVVTGTILSFEFGILWPNFIGTFGNVFGLGFALEGFSFFVEAIFIGIYVYGWDRLAPRRHILAGIPVVIAGITGSTFVIAVNAWMNHPSGFRLQHGHAVDVHPWAALFGNSFLWPELVHMYLGAYMVVGFLVAGWYALCRLRGRFGRYERAALAIALAAAALASPVEGITGDWAAREVAKDQPIKLAAMEGLGRTTKGAPEHILGWYENGKVKYGIRIPHLLSLLADHSWNATIQGLDTVPPQDRPPVNVVRISFQTMVAIGTALALLAAAYLLVRVRRKQLPRSRWFYRAVIAAGPLAFVAAVAGWITTEVGRQPWIVYGVMRTTQAVTGAKGIPVGYATLAGVYVALALAVAWVLRRLAHSPLSDADAARA
jgi:cytochrome d ubiquinol oxidase subunit I